MSAERMRTQTTVTFGVKNYDEFDLIELENFVSQARSQGLTTIKVECSAGYPGNQFDHEEPSARLIAK